jgi:hypothetical protein
MCLYTFFHNLQKEKIYFKHNYTNGNDLQVVFEKIKVNSIFDVLFYAYIIILENLAVPVFFLIYLICIAICMIKK